MSISHLLELDFQYAAVSGVDVQKYSTEAKKAHDLLKTRSGGG